MSYLNYHPNDMVYVENIGYGTLTNCGKFETLSLKNLNLSMKKSSLIFDPDMFNPDENISKCDDGIGVQV